MMMKSTETAKSSDNELMARDPELAEHDGSMSAATTAAEGRDSSLSDTANTREDQEPTTKNPDDQTTTSTKKAPRGKSKKYISILFGLAFLAGLVFAIMALVDFMKEGNVKFVEQEPATAVIAMEELALHDSEDDCWVGVHGKVYDLTMFVHRHPGRPELILEQAGTNATREWDKEHASPVLLRQVENFIIGTMAEAEVAP
jgi:cytochrome b involved in lipid metabolism